MHGGRCIIPSWRAVLDYVPEKVRIKGWAADGRAARQYWSIEITNQTTTETELVRTQRGYNDTYT